jgi:release factor glutamine methyltransferase
MQSFNELLNYGTALLEDAGIEHCQNDAWILLEACTGKSRTEMVLYGTRLASRAEEINFLSFIDRRRKREPVAYILEEQEFWSLSFRVSPAVLIPRPETEFLLDRVLALTDKDNLARGKILDLCCGSGVIATVLAKETKKNIIGVDISCKALDVAIENVRRHGVLEQVSLAQMDLFAALQPSNQFSLIVSNPPYVSTFDIKENLDKDVVGYEPWIALDGGFGGMKYINMICKALPSMLCDGGQFFMEIGADQGNDVRDLFNAGTANDQLFEEVEVLADYAGRDRVLVARYCKKGCKGTEKAWKSL